MKDNEKVFRNFIVEAYPVILSIKDVAVTATSIAVTGYLIARLPVSRFLKDNG